MPSCYASSKLLYECHTTCRSQFDKTVPKNDYKSDIYKKTVNDYEKCDNACDAYYNKWKHFDRCVNRLYDATCKNKLYDAKCKKNKDVEGDCYRWVKNQCMPIDF